jgi:DNA transposition AAA+ family ATPase
MANNDNKDKTAVAVTIAQQAAIDTLSKPADRITFGPAVFARGIAKYPERVREHLQWLWGYNFSQLGNSATELSKRTGIPTLVLIDIFIGRFEGNWKWVVEAIEKLRAATAAAMPIVETCVVKNIWKGLSYARTNHTMIRITGQTGRGKTYAAKCWAAMNNHGCSRYIRVTAGCTRTQLLKQIARTFGFTNTHFSGPVLEDALLKGDIISERNVLILDEAGHLMPRGSRSNTQPLELVRDIYDVCGCGVALIFTDVYIQDMENGYWKDFLEQFRGRITYKVDIPVCIFREEVEQIVNSFAPNPSRTLVDLAYKSLSLKKDGNLRRLFENLRRAKLIADQAEREMDAHDLSVVLEHNDTAGIWPKEGVRR